MRFKNVIVWKEAAFLYHIFHLDQLEVSANAVNLFPHFGEIMFEFMLCWVLLSYVTNECSHFFPLYFLLISVCNIKRWTSLCLSRRLRTRFSDFCSNNYNIHILERKKKIRNQIYFIFFLILNNNFKKEEIEHWCFV